jgi:hypothetical protein
MLKCLYLPIRSGRFEAGLAEVGGVNTATSGKCPVERRLEEGAILHTHCSLGTLSC